MQQNEIGKIYTQLKSFLKDQKIADLITNW